MHATGDRLQPRPIARDHLLFIPKNGWEVCTADMQGGCCCAHLPASQCPLPHLLRDLKDTLANLLKPRGRPTDSYLVTPSYSYRLLAQSSSQSASQRFPCDKKPLNSPIAIAPTDSVAAVQMLDEGRGGCTAIPIEQERHATRLATRSIRGLYHNDCRVVHGYMYK